ncbi:hypothetical protein T11_2100 [Trichinella zimbabwensis]|uniref:Uncharacterized protein n=1 Tax=Trichinella zimbabwensis TaxID=268475 RepID=A0A0V1DLR9_9BILA|nr:hypothetical protein T11_2100 [Trichinella zimbabwensis]
MAALLRDCKFLLTLSLMPPAHRSCRHTRYSILSYCPAEPPHICILTL